MNLAVTECLHRSDLCSLFFDHSCHGRKADECCNQKKDHREYLTDIFDTVCIVSVIGIFRKVIAVCDDPFRFFEVVQFFFRIADLLLTVADLIFRFFPAILVFFLSIL